MRWILIYRFFSLFRSTRTRRLWNSQHKKKSGGRSLTDVAEISRDFVQNRLCAKWWWPNRGRFMHSWNSNLAIAEKRVGNGENEYKKQQQNWRPMWTDCIMHLSRNDVGQSDKAQIERERKTHKLPGIYAVFLYLDYTARAENIARSGGALSRCRALFSCSDTDKSVPKKSLFKCTWRTTNHKSRIGPCLLAYPFSTKQMVCTYPHLPPISGKKFNLFSVETTKTACPIKNISIFCCLFSSSTKHTVLYGSMHTLIKWEKLLRLTGTRTQYIYRNFNL